MTGEEMERAIEFLLQSQANHQVRLDELTAQVTETSNQLQTHAETQTQFIEIVTRTLEGLAASQERTDRKIAESNARIAETNARSEQRIAETNERIEQLAAENKARGAEIDARLDRLAALVERNITGGNGNS